MKIPAKVVVVDDQIDEILWLLDSIRRRGYEVDVAPDEASARKLFAAVRAGEIEYALAIIDVMVAVADIRVLLGQGGEEKLEDSEDTGIRLCRYVREELGLTSRELPIACLTVRDDREVSEAMYALKVPLFHRIPEGGESIRDFVESKLPLRARVEAPCLT